MFDTGANELLAGLLSYFSLVRCDACPNPLIYDELLGMRYILVSIAFGAKSTLW